MSIKYDVKGDEHHLFGIRVGDVGIAHLCAADSDPAVKQGIWRATPFQADARGTMYWQAPVRVTAPNACLHASVHSGLATEPPCTDVGRRSSP